MLLIPFNISPYLNFSPTTAKRMENKALITIEPLNTLIYPPQESKIGNISDTGNQKLRKRVIEETFLYRTKNSKVYLFFRTRIF